LQEYKSTHGKEKKPVKSRGKHPVTPGTVCPQCGAPHNYLYDNTGGRGQLWCKVCDLRFSRNKTDFKPITFVCPYCGHTLDKKKHRKHFNVHKCVNRKCPFYINSLKSLSPEDFEEYKNHKHKFKLHYIYREFTIVDSYNCKPTNFLAADETYVKVKGVKHYVWFIMDAIKKSILGYQVSNSRDVGPCILAMRMAFKKFKEFPGKALKFVCDGYTSYNLAQQQFALNNMNFNLTQVIGLTNDDPVSTEYRWLKQIIERLNRTFKFSYRVTNGYGSHEGSNAHVSLFVAYYNFLRPHSYSYWQLLNSITELESLPNMPAKWQKLIELSQQLILSSQTS
jgi:transposase-like protein/transcription elongation factor Elf1